MYCMFCMYYIYIYIYIYIVCIVCIVLQDFPLLMLFEFMENGDLRQYLRNGVSYSLPSLLGVAVHVADVRLHHSMHLICNVLVCVSKVFEEILSIIMHSDYRIM
jgi:hypothetical protein